MLFTKKVHLQSHLNGNSQKWNKQQYQTFTLHASQKKEI